MTIKGSGMILYVLYVLALKELSDNLYTLEYKNVINISIWVWVWVRVWVIN